MRAKYKKVITRQKELKKNVEEIFFFDIALTILNFLLFASYGCI